MRIGIEAQRLFRKKKHGMDVVILEIIKNLQVIDKRNEYYIYVKEDEDCCLHDTENFKIKVLPKHNYAYWEQVILPKEARKDSVDILHCTSNTAPIYYNGKLMLTLHDIIYLERFGFSGSPYQNFGNLYRRLVVPKVVQKSNHIITVSNFEKSNIVKYFNGLNSPVSVVYNGVSDSFSKQNEKTINPKLEGLPEEYILFLGNTAHKKNTVGVLEAYQVLRKNFVNAPTLVITDVEESYIISLLQSKGAEDLINHIYIKDYIPYSTMASLYSNAKVFIYPSLRESFGLPILEAMAAGTPVVTSNITSMPEVAGDSAILINPNSPSEIANGIQLLLENKDNIVERKILLGFERAQKFNWKNSAKELLSLYQMVFKEIKE